METFLMIVQFIVSISLIAVVVAQRSKGEGLGSIGGGSRIFFDQNKGMNATLERATKILGVAFMVLSLVITIL